MNSSIYKFLFSEAGNKVVEKIWSEEAVGVVCKLEGKIQVWQDIFSSPKVLLIRQVVEYSEITNETSELRSSDGRLTYCAGNVCNHFFTTDFLKVCRKIALNPVLFPLPFSLFKNFLKTVFDTFLFDNFLLF